MVRTESPSAADPGGGPGESARPPATPHPPRGDAAAPDRWRESRLLSRFGPARGDSGPADAERLVAVLRRLEDLVDWERRDRSPGAGRVMRVDLEPARALLERLGHPEHAFRSVHVAGTKGKGSVAALVAAGLARVGLRAGVYASPHVERIHERVRIAGEPVGDGALARALETVLDARAAGLDDAASRLRDATWFDVFTAAAFVVLRDAGAEWAAVECGLGGRLDSTNAIHGEVCAITSIGLEHTAILGSTRAAIAAEKAGILEPGRPVVAGLDPEDEAGVVVARIARELGAPVRWCPPRPGETLEERNVALAAACLDVVGGSIADPVRGVHGGLLGPDERAAARLPGRLERLDVERVPVVLDGAHVTDSLRAILDELGRREDLSAPPVVVFGTARDKDARGLLKVLRGRVDRVVCTSVGEGPVVRPEELAAAAAELGLAAEAIGEPRTALSRALRLAPPGGWVLVTGSLHLVGAVRGALANRTAPC